ncbi:hypothetical protein WJX84_000652 [Apatococcus fuscideae]|uniref:ABC1 atypical kinase-like domain-containing protein n=1 Tax=Apatococcus fuscideae TaxID=2026836 RepID=A0AAW1RYI3_9CHLO
MLAVQKAFAACFRTAGQLQVARVAGISTKVHLTQAPLGVVAPTTSSKRTVTGTLLRSLGYFGVASATGTAAWIGLSEDPRKRARIALYVPQRLLRDLCAAALIVGDYQFSLRGLEGSERDSARAACHRRCADRLQKVCFANGGIYIKLGQHIAQLDHVMPKEYVQTMQATMLDHCPVSSYAEVSRIIQEELGKPPEDLFVTMEQTPLASASLAQVHVAESRDGRKLAVKVQHETLSDTSSADIATIDTLVRIVHWVYPDLNYTWLVEQAQDYLPKELDFVHEADNAERCRANFQSSASNIKGRVAIPWVVRELSSRRVLTMEYIEGIKVTDKAQLEAAGISPSDVAKVVSTVFNEMIFIFGDVHCDPHAANMFVRKRKGRRGRGRDNFELILLDHGLYRQIGPDFRREYAQLWRGLILGEVEAIRKHSQAMNAGDMYPLFAAMLTSRPWDQITKRESDHLKIAGSEEEKEQLRMQAQKVAREISSLLWRIPRELLLLLKTNDCLRSVDHALGQNVNTFVITARACTRGQDDPLDTASDGDESRAHALRETILGGMVQHEPLQLSESHLEDAIWVKAGERSHLRSRFAGHARYLENLQSLSVNDAKSHPDVTLALLY